MHTVGVKTSVKNAVLASALLATLSPAALGLQKKPVYEVTTDAIVSDTQVSPKGVSDSHSCLVWWIPEEFWSSLLSRDASVSETQRKGVMKAVSGVSLLAVVQADISDFGAFKYYTPDDVEKNMKVEYVSPSGKRAAVELESKPDPNLQVILATFKPVLSQAMGNLGNNLHFFVLKDTSPSGSRIVDPYEAGELVVSLADSSSRKMEGVIQLPLDSLYIPRKCPNGRDANVSWKFCPWTGEKLP